jgi:hypothetical protein
MEYRVGDILRVPTRARYKYKRYDSLCIVEQVTVSYTCQNSFFYGNSTFKKRECVLEMLITNNLA